MEITSVILKPRLTEKTQSMRAMENPKMAFLVNGNANKHQIAMAFRAIFGIEAQAVNVINRKPSRARYMNKSRDNFRKAKRIAIVTVNKQDFEQLKELEQKLKEEKKS